MKTTRTEPVIGSRFSPTIQTHMKKQKGMKKHTHNKQGLSSRTALTGKQTLDLRPYQDEVFWRQSGTLVLHWSRQIGKSFVLATWAVRRLINQLGKNHSLSASAFDYWLPIH